MSCSSLTAAAASSPQLMSGSITSSIRPTPDTREHRPGIFFSSQHPPPNLHTGGLKETLIDFGFVC